MWNCLQSTNEEHIQLSWRRQTYDMLCIYNILISLAHCGAVLFPLDLVPTIDLAFTLRDHRHAARELLPGRDLTT